MKRYKDSWCKPIVTRTGQPIAGGAARNYLIGLYPNGIDDVIERAGKAAVRIAFDDMRSKLDVDRMVGKATRALEQEESEIED